MSLKHPAQNSYDIALANLEDSIQQFDQRTRSFKRQLEKHHFFIIGKLPVDPLEPPPAFPEHFIISSETETAFVGADRLLSGGNNTSIHRPHTKDMSRDAKTVMDSAQKLLKSITTQAEPLKLKFKQFTQPDKETEEELEVLRDWLKTAEYRVEIIRETLERVTAKEKGGWEIGVIVTSTEEWEFSMRAHQWR